MSLESKSDYNNVSDESATNDPQTDSTRREAIGKIGKFAAYTAPAMLAMLTGEAKAQGASVPL